MFENYEAACFCAKGRMTRRHEGASEESGKGKTPSTHARLLNLRLCSIFVFVLSSLMKVTRFSTAPSHPSPRYCFHPPFTASLAASFLWDKLFHGCFQFIQALSQ